MTPTDRRDTLNSALSLTKEDLGLSDGEAAERLWAYMRRFSRMSKEMTPTDRRDTLNSALSPNKGRCWPERWRGNREVVGLHEKV